MLHFFRTYQRYFFIVVTTIIVLSFSFFGTYQAIDTTPTVDRVAFIAVDGSEVRASEVEMLSHFLATESALKTTPGGPWAGNFLNDGVLTNDILVTGLGEELIAHYGDLLQSDLEPRLKREKNASFYVHPAAKFVSAESVWQYFAPDVKGGLDELRVVTVPQSVEGFRARARLFLAEQQFPSSLLTQVLRYQEQQYPWLTADPNLPRLDLSLFGYHTIEDWFGPRFLKLASQFIINASKIAEQKGYRVTTEEALADLISHSEISYQNLSNKANLGITSPRQYMNEQLRRLGLDEVTAAKLWKQVLLFRRLFESVGNAIFVDPLLFQQYTSFALETADGELYQLSPSMHLKDFRALQKFEAYLLAVTDKGANQSPLAVPDQFRTVAQVQQKDPDLVQKRYLVEMTQASKKALQARVVVREMWNWETKDSNWELLKKEFPELGVKKAANVNERFAALESLDATTRSRVDEFARSAIVDAHSEWLEEALSGNKPETLVIGIRMKGGSLPIQGVEDRQALAALLDAVPLTQTVEISGGAKAAQDKLQNFTADNRNFYRITVRDRDPDWTIMSFAEASSDETLNKKVLSLLEPFYTKIRASDPEKYRKADQSWKSIEEVQDAVAADYFKDLLTAIEKEYRGTLPGTKDTEALGSRGAAAYRFLWYVRQAREQIMKDASKASVWVATEAQMTEDNKLPPISALANQWKLLDSSFTLRRSDDGASAGREVIFDLKPDQWSNVGARPSGDLWFFQMKSIGPAENSVIVGQAMRRAHEELGGDGERMLMYQVMDLIKQKNAISFLYLERQPEGDAHEDSQESL